MVFFPPLGNARQGALAQCSLYLERIPDTEYTMLSKKEKKKKVCEICRRSVSVMSTPCSMPDKGPKFLEQRREKGNFKFGVASR